MKEKSNLRIAQVTATVFLLSSFPLKTFCQTTDYPFRIDSPSACYSDCFLNDKTSCRELQSVISAYCCDRTGTTTSIDSRCNTNSNYCTSGQTDSNDISKYWSCPFDYLICGEQQLYVDTDNQTITIDSTDFHSYTFCYYELISSLQENRTMNLMVTEFSSSKSTIVTGISTSIASLSSVSKPALNSVTKAQYGQNMYLLVRSISSQVDSITIQYWLGDLYTNNTSTTNNTNSSTTNTTNNSNNSNQTTNQNQTTNNQSNQSGENSGLVSKNTGTTGLNQDPGSSESNTSVIVIAVIAVVVIMIPVSCLIVYLVKRFRKKNAQGGKGDQTTAGVNIGDPQVVDEFNFEGEYVDANGRINGPAQDPENMAEIMRQIQLMEARENLGQSSGPQYHNERDSIQPMQQMHNNFGDDDNVNIPIDQLPPFLQEMAMNDPVTFQQMMAEMDEEQLAKFISEQEIQQKGTTYKNQRNQYQNNEKDEQNYSNEQEFDANDPENIAQQKAIYENLQKNSIGYNQQNYNQNEEGVIDLDNSEQNLEFLVGMGDDGYANFKPSKKKKKSNIQ